MCDGDSECENGSDESTGLCYAIGECGGNFSSQSGMITSPLFPNQYPSKADCVYTISRPSRSIINLSVTMIDTIGCYDSLEIRDGHSENSKLMDRFCGKNLHLPVQMQSTQNQVWIR